MKTNTLRGIHVFFAIASFFAVVIGADVYFVTRAVATFPGEEVKNSYVLGLEYNQEVRRREHQKQLGWTAEAGFVEAGGGALMVRMRSAEGPLTGLAVTAIIHVPGGKDEALILKEGSAGEYVAAFSAAGVRRAEAEIAVRRPGETEPVFEAQKPLRLS